MAHITHAVITYTILILLLTLMALNLHLERPNSSIKTLTAEQNAHETKLIGPLEFRKCVESLRSTKRTETVCVISDRGGTAAGRRRVLAC